MDTKNAPIQAGYLVIFRTWYKNGTRVYADDYGLKAWRLVAPVKK